MRPGYLSSHVLPIFWIIFMLVWFVSAIGIKRTRLRETRRGTIFQVTFGILIFLIFAFRLGPLNGRFLPPDPIIEAVGLALTAIGIGIAIWARYYLGRNWSANVVLKQDHELIR